MRFTTVLVATLVVLASFATPVAAEGWLDSFTDDDEDDSFLDAVKAFVGGLSDRASYAVSNIGRDAPDAEDEAADLVEFFNGKDDDGNIRSEQVLSWANKRSTASTNYDVFRFTIEQEDSRSRVYVVATVNETSGDYETVEMLTTKPADRDVDEEIVLSKFAADNATEELEHFYETYVVEDEDVDNAYVRQLAGKYGGHVETDLEVA